MFLTLVLANCWNAEILDRFAQLGIKDWWLTAGCVCQSVWNALYGRPPVQDILDYDIFYFDPGMSWKAEGAAAVCAGLAELRGRKFRMTFQSPYARGGTSGDTLRCFAAQGATLARPVATRQRARLTIYLL